MHSSLAAAATGVASRGSWRDCLVVSTSSHFRGSKVIHVRMRHGHPQQYLHVYMYTWTPTRKMPAVTEIAQTGQTSLTSATTRFHTKPDQQMPHSIGQLAPAIHFGFVCCLPPCILSSTCCDLLLVLGCLFLTSIDYRFLVVVISAGRSEQQPNIS